MQGFDIFDTRGMEIPVGKDHFNGATSGTTNATLTSKVKGLAYNNIVASTVIVEDTTDNGGAEAKSTATIAAATLAVLAAGDTVEFAGEVFTKVASGATGNQFTNTAGLIALIDAIDGWTAAENAGAIEIEASENGAENDGVDVIVTLRRPTAGGINGTVGLRDQIVTDAAYLYVCTANNTVNDSNWRRVALGSVY